MAKAQAIGVSRGAQTTKIHAVCDLLGRPRRADANRGPDLRHPRRRTLDAGGDPFPPPRRGQGLRGRFRKTLRGAGTTPIIPGRSNRKRRIRYDERCYRDRWLIEAMFCRLKDFRRIATRYDKLAANFLSAAALAAVVAFWT
ncbi:transposase [Bradyrhizobium sp. SZCCHNR2020]|uniref:transposase n=1 Tax=Bradyrhizobium sp. SZCCHNR2020 TaxID=3057379 RepID=UPI0039670A97